MKDTILADALRLVTGDRNSSYGPPLEDYTRTVALFNTLTGRDLAPEEGTLFMACVKLSRIGQHLATDAPAEAWRDSLTDLAGYAECTWQIVQRSVAIEQ